MGASGLISDVNAEFRKFKLICFPNLIGYGLLKVYKYKSIVRLFYK